MHVHHGVEGNLIRIILASLNVPCPKDKQEIASMKGWKLIVSFIIFSWKQKIINILRLLQCNVATAIRKFQIYIACMCGVFRWRFGKLRVHVGIFFVHFKFVRNEQIIAWTLFKIYGLDQLLLDPPLCLYIRSLCSCKPSATELKLFVISNINSLYLYMYQPQHTCTLCIERELLLRSVNMHFDLWSYVTCNNSILIWYYDWKNCLFIRKSISINILLESRSL